MRFIWQPQAQVVLSGSWWISVRGSSGGSGLRLACPCRQTVCRRAVPAPRSSPPGPLRPSPLSSWACSTGRCSASSRRSASVCAATARAGERSILVCLADELLVLGDEQLTQGVGVEGVEVGGESHAQSCRPRSLTIGAFRMVTVKSSDRRRRPVAARAARAPARRTGPGRRERTVPLGPKKAPLLSRRQAKPDALAVMDQHLHPGAAPVGEEIGVMGVPRRRPGTTWARSVSMPARMSRARPTATGRRPGSPEPPRSRAPQAAAEAMGQSTVTVGCPLRSSRRMGHQRLGKAAPGQSRPSAQRPPP